MFQITRSGNRLDIDLQGKLDRVQMKAALEEFEVKSAGIENGVMLYRITDFHFPSLAAIGIELSHLPLLFRMVRNFERAAILADESWLRRFSEWEAKLIPDLEIRAFPLDEDDAAERWLRPPVLM